MARVDRKWSQAEMAKMLQDKGLHAMYPTTVAKIESGERAVRIDEAVAIGDLFGLSLDSLFGRKAGAGNDLAFAFSNLLDVVRQSNHEMSMTIGLLRDRWAHVAVFEFEGKERLESLIRDAGDALMAAHNALFLLTAFEVPEDAQVPMDSDMVQQKAFEILLELMKGDSDATES